MDGDMSQAHGHLQDRAEEQRGEDVEQVEVDAALLDHPEPCEATCRPARNVGSTPVEHRVGHVTLERVGFGNSPRAAAVRARAKRPGEQPDEHLGERRGGVLHPRRRRGVAAAPGACVARARAPSESHEGANATSANRAALVGRDRARAARRC